MRATDPAALRSVLSELEQAGRDHLDWYTDVVRGIVCGLPPDPDKLAPDADRRCRFGRWYHGDAPGELREHAACTALAAEHERVHCAATALLEGAAHARADGTLFDAFEAASRRLRLELDSLRHEIESALRARDPVTGAHGREDVVPKLGELRELARRRVQRSCIAFVDLDRFKTINDTHGHALGDEVLAGVVRFIAGRLRPYDQVFRYGGDEFLITLPGVDLAAAHAVIDRIRAALEQATLAVAPDGDAVRITVSCGLASIDPDLEVAESIDRADRALMLAKAAGRNRVINWDPAIATGTMAPRLVEDRTAG